jgi:predicted GIY-YIG superfamily endonuclease
MKRSARWNPQVVYRLFNEAGELLYIGMTGRLGQRLKNHASTQPWWNEVATVTEEPVPGNYMDAAQVERRAIAKEFPKYNVRDRAPDRPVPTPDGQPLFIPLGKSCQGNERWRCTICDKVIRKFDLDRCRVKHGYVDELA